PLMPEDLLKHDCLLLMRGRRVYDRWRFVDHDKPYEVQVRGRVFTNSSEVTYQWALSGHGIALKALYDIEEDLNSGRLVECLPAYASDAIDLYISYTTRLHLPVRA